MNLYDYLKQKHTENTVKRYMHDIGQYQRFTSNHKGANYKDIMEYIGYLRSRKIKGITIRTTLYSIKKYYRYLQFTNQRKDHPCRFIKLRDGKTNDIQLQDLFTKKELEKLKDRKERYGANKLRNQIIISLLIYQGLTKAEITKIRLEDIDLDDGNIYIRPSRKLNERTLKLKTSQIMLLYKYIKIERPKLIKTTTNNLIITLRGTPETGEGIHYLIESMQDKYPGRKLTPTSIRQSVITNLLKDGKDLRIVQVFAGHKKPTSTEKYKQTNVELLKVDVLKYHPLG